MKESIGKAIILGTSVINLALAVVITYIPILQFLMGSRIWIIQIPLILGALIMGCAVLGKERWFTPKQTRNLIVFGALIGYTNFIGLLGSGPYFDEIKTQSSISRRIWRLLIWPLLLMVLSFTLFIPMFEDRTNMPLLWHGRNGLTFVETLWDYRLFWAEWSYSLMLIVLIIGLLWWRYPLVGNDLKPEFQRKIKTVGIISIGVACAVLLIMLFFLEGTETIWPNSFSTQFAYEIVSWPSMIVLGMLFMIEIPSNTSKSHSITKNRTIASLIPLYSSIILFTIIWLVRSATTEYHPYAIFSFKTPIYYLLMTGLFIFPIVAFLIRWLFSSQRINTTEQSVNSADTPINPERKKNVKLILMLFLIMLFTMVFILALQLYADTQTPAIGTESIFDIDPPWWWILAHWPSFLFICSSSFGGYFLTGQIINRFTSRARKEVSISSEEEIHRKNEILKINQKKYAKVNALLVIGMISLLSFTTGSQVQAEWDRREAPMLLVNQVGYFPTAPKRVLFQWQGNISFDNPIPFAVYPINSSVPIHEGMLEIGPQRYGYTYLIGDFSNLTTFGQYLVRCEYQGLKYESCDFAIAENILDEALEWQYRFFYYQRCNYKVESIVPGYIGHEACHLDDAEVYTGTEWVHKDLTGGWHDAGDYNKYNSWFQTQWYCTQALAEASLIDAKNLTSTYASLYDSELPDAIDEALWGMKFLLNCINEEGYQGEENRYRIWVDVLGYRHQSDREARMSYSGPPEYDWTTPRRAPFKENNSTFGGIGTGYLFAGTLMQMARLIDETTTQSPDIVWPTWVTTNTTEIRRLAKLVYEKHKWIEEQANSTNLEIGSHLIYLEEVARWENNWTAYDAWVLKAIDDISSFNTYPYWFTWAGAYYFGTILMQYITTNRTLPTPVREKIEDIQEEQFSLLFDEPFLVKHNIHYGNKVLFLGAERHTDILTSAWLQAVICKIAPDIGKPELVQSMLDWLFGVNPSGYSFVEGMGDRNTPLYHHRYASVKNPTGAVPGAIPNGVGLFQLTKSVKSSENITNDLDQLVKFGDCPEISDFPASLIIREGAKVNPNEVWIPYNAMAIKFLTMIESQELF